MRTLTNRLEKRKKERKKRRHVNQIVMTVDVFAKFNFHTSRIPL